jgi:outer membrane protein assembly factor BamE
MNNHIATPYPMPAKNSFSIRSVQSLALALFAGLLLSACAGISTSNSSINPVNWITPYKVDVIQGNFVSSEQVGMLKAGMTRPQVKEVLGTPLVTSIFHADRWDYVFTFKRQGVQSQSYRYSVFFKGDRLESFSGDDMPSEAEFITRLDSQRKLGKIPALQATPEQLKEADAQRSAKPAAQATPAANPLTAPAGAQAATYPPLERPAQ